ncbi:unnamed protein product [Didymodactylos carnosus]|nr:unnamed protein product [Didymodactylos carnosus]CAF3539285.1 unnamed protein product [Didymodactylos carnosus]
MLLSVVKTFTSNDDRKRMAYRERITSYLERAEQLKKLIKEQEGSCVYSTGDCIADAISSITCLTDGVTCIVFASKKNLPTCENKLSNYLHIEYQCVPIIMQDTSKVYDVCQTGDITSDHGIITSPGYPTQFQTTTNECLRAIHVPDNKLIQLWLTDLYIGSSPSQNCQKDHVLVVDSVANHRHCSMKRFTYPTLCSTTIFIQYYATTTSTSYRGMRLYFEIIDRPSNINCPQVTVTPAPLSTTPMTIPFSTTPHMTTTAPIYAQLGIASPKIDVQLCKGQFKIISCPTNYLIAIHTILYAVVPSNECEAFNSATHCSITAESTLSCGKSCTVSYYGNKIIPTCSNQEATYQLVSYQCIPDNAPLLTDNQLCTNGPISINISKNGEFQSNNYPFPTEDENCTYHLKTDVGKIIHIYSLDVSLSDLNLDCKKNHLTIIDGDDQEVFCDVFYSELIYSSCSNEVAISYYIIDINPVLHYGVQLYIETEQRPADHCGKTDPPPTKPTDVTYITPTIPTISPTQFLGALSETDAVICFGDKPTFTCPFGYTFIIIDAFFGVKKSPTDACQFQQGDCIQDASSTITTCQHDDPICYLPFTVKRKLAHCQDLYADYMHVIYQCIPNKGLTPDLVTYDICASSDIITGFNGLLVSPGFPKYQTVTPECKRVIIPMREKALKIWINEMAISSGNFRTTNNDESQSLAKSADLIIHRSPSSLFINAEDHIRYGLRDVCPTDYLIINNANDISYMYCGTRKLVLQTLCATEIYIQYYAPSVGNSFYKGFKLYFEEVDKALDIFCHAGHSLFPNLSTTTEDPSVLPPWAVDSQLSPILPVFLCRGSIGKMSCPSNYVVSIYHSYYGVTGTGQCEAPDNSHCQQEAGLSLSCTHTCLVDYIIPKQLILCNNADADYLNIDYQCIPAQLNNGESSIDICSTSLTETLAINRGIITSPQFPQLGLQTRRCSKTIQTTPDKVWEIYIVDVFLESEDINGNCNDASLTLNDGNDGLTLCGLQQPQRILTSCSDKVKIEFTSNRQALGYRGFKLYFQTIDVPSNWACAPTGFSTTTSTKGPPPTTSKLPPSILIQTYGGTTNGSMQYCTFPFLHLNLLQSACLPPETAPTIGGSTDSWCSLTENFDVDKQWGYCYLGVTQTTLYDICPGQFMQLKCPAGYVIDIVASMYATKNPDSDPAQSCVYDVNDCFVSDGATAQQICGGKTSCIVYYFDKTLASCQNRRSSYLHIDYVCVPNAVPYITQYDFCGSTTTITPTSAEPIKRGFILSPNYPNTPPGLNCTITIQPPDQQDIYIYILDMQLTASLQQNCVKDKFIQIYDGLTQETCGQSYTNFLLNTCHSPLTLQLIKSSDSTSKGLKLYFEFIERSIDTTCPLPPPISSTKPTLTTQGPLPDYYPYIQTPMQTKSFCYPDFTSLFGNNIQCTINNYVLVIRRAFHGKGSKCGYTHGDCVMQADSVYRTCAGKQACAMPFLTPVTVAECGSVATYLYIEYECMPDLTVHPPQDICSTQQTTLAMLGGTFISPSYPSYVVTQCDNISLRPEDNSDLILYMYLIELNIEAEDSTSGTCSNDYLTFSYKCDGQLIENKLCGTRKTQLLFETCNANETVQIAYKTQNQLQQQGGFALYYQYFQKPTEITTLPTRPTTMSTTRSTSTPDMVVAGPIQTETVCSGQTRTLSCPRNSVIALLQIDMGVSETDVCSFSRNDCFEERTYLYGVCAGQTACVIHFTPLPVADCSNKRATYLYAEYQCLPISGQIQMHTCDNESSINVQRSASILSRNYPTYTPSSENCAIQLHAPRLLGSPNDRSFKIYIVAFNLPSTTVSGGQGSQCDDVNDAYVDLYDDFDKKIRLCGNLHTRYIFETCSSTISIRFKDVSKQISVKYKGFNIYFEAVDRNPQDCSGITIVPPVLSIPLDIYDQTVCSSYGRGTVTMQCTENHGLLFLHSYQYSTSKPDECQINDQLCRYPSEQPQTLCRGQTMCTYTFVHQPYPPSFGCSVASPDLINFQYQCIPNILMQTPEYNIAVLCQDSTISFEKGFISTPNYPAFSYGKNCKIRIRLSNEDTTDLRYLRLYLLDLSIRQSPSVINQDMIPCYDSVTYGDLNTNNTLCGEIDEQKFLYETLNGILEIDFNTKTVLPTDDTLLLRGALFFFYVRKVAAPSTTYSPPPTTIETIEQTSTESPKNKHITAIIIGVVVGLCVVIILLGVVLHRKGLLFNVKKSSPDVHYQQNTVQIQDPARSSLAPTPFVMKEGLRPTSLENPLYSKQTLHFHNHPNGTTDA